MRRLFSLIVLFSVAACAAVGQVASTNLSLSSLPAPVQKTVREQSAGAQLVEIERNLEDGEPTFTVTLKKGGEERELTVREDGELLSVQVGLDEAPPVVQKTIKAQIGQGTLQSITKTIEDNDISYDVEMTRKDGSSRSFTVALDGKLISAQLDLEETPPAVRRTIQASIGTGKMGDIYRVLEEGEIFYLVEVTRDGKPADLNISVEGKLQSMQVSLSDTPPSVQQTINEKLGDGKLLRIDKSFEPKQGVLPYEIEARKDGKPFNFSVGPKGKFLGMDD